MKVKKRYFLKKKKIKEIKKSLGEYETLINNKDKIELLEVDPYDFILINGEPNIIIIDEKPYPTLKALLNNPEIESKKVTVDMGAVKFMTKGADVMSPGITETDENGNVIKGDVIAVDTFDSVVVSKKRLVATVGLSDIAVIETADAVLGLPKNRAQDVKKIVEKLKADGRKGLL